MCHTCQEGHIGGQEHSAGPKDPGGYGEDSPSLKN